VDAGELADRIESELRAVGTPERAAGEKRYLKSDLDFLGCSLSQIRAAVQQLVRANPELTRASLVELVETLWSKPIFERRMAAAMLLDRYLGLLRPDDLRLIERLVRESKTWALVDWLAGDVAGAIVLAHPEASATLDRWAADDDFWVRRSALLSQLRPLRRGADFTQFGRHADALLDEREFFIRKAIGWVLRETGKRRPQEVYDWLAPRVGRASGVTFSEAVKYLPAEQAAALRQARGAGRRAIGRPAG
jgi:3-methyladenine DNA glycosylase AlkD